MEIKRFEKRLKNQGYPCSKWALCLCPGLALFSVLITEPLLTTAKSCSSLRELRGERAQLGRCKGAAQALLPCQLFLNTSKASFPQGFVSEGSANLRVAALLNCSVTQAGVSCSLCKWNYNLAGAHLSFLHCAAAWLDLPSEDLPSGFCLTLFDTTGFRRLWSEKVFLFSFLKNLPNFSETTWESVSEKSEIVESCI